MTEKPRPKPKSVNVRISPEADRLARIAAGYAGQSKSAFASRAVIEVAEREIAAAIARHPPRKGNRG